MRWDQAFAGAFREPVFQSQSVFRSLMDCMARPGTAGELAAGDAPPEPLGAAAGAIALTLCDHDTAVYLTPGLSKSAVPHWLAFHTGAPVTGDHQAGRFAFIEKGAPLPGFSLFAQGTQEYPDRSATLVVELVALTGGRPLILQGPGIDSEKVMAPDGLPDMFPALWAENCQGFPRGVDLILVAGDRVLCLPRTTTIRIGEA